VSQAAVAMADDRLDGLAGRSVLVVGAGEMGEGMAVALAGAGVAEVRVANRTAARANALAARVGGRAVPLAEFPNHLADVDLVLTSTGSPTLLLEQGDLVPVMAARPDRPLLVVDIAMPRDVDPGVAEVEGVTLLDMDDLRAFASLGLAERRREVATVEGILNEELDRYLGASSAREVAPVIVALRERADDLRRAEIERLRSRAGGLDDRTAEMIESVTRGLVAKLLHQPTVVLKESAGSQRGDRLVVAVRDLFDVGEG
jgi:glutamyl-tRNA reductase